MNNLNTSGALKIDVMLSMICVVFTPERVALPEGHRGCACFVVS